MSAGDSIVIDLKNEGPDCKELGLYSLIERCAAKFKYDISNITIDTCNVLEHHDTIQIKSRLSVWLLQRELNKQYNHNVVKNPSLKHFGRLVGRSSANRLFLSEYLDTNHKDKTVSTFHYKHGDNYHKDDIGLEELVTRYNIRDVSPYAKFLSTCPRTDTDFNFDKSLDIDFSTQLHNIEKDSFIDLYRKFAIEIVSETYITGNTFFVTEKIWRPILLKTPFIVHGPAGFLKNLRNLGFKTFSDFWDEGYDDDPPEHAMLEIVKVIDTIAKEPVDELVWMLKNMQDILDYNYNVLMEIKNVPFSFKK